MCSFSRMGFCLVFLALLHSARGCTPLSQCTDRSGYGKCNEQLAGGFYCKDLSRFGSQCEQCSCEAGCEDDQGDGTPLNWRPGNTNPYGVSSSSDGGPIALSAQQQKDLVDQHNFVRAYHGACPLQWSEEIAQNVADKAMSAWSRCSLAHTSNDRNEGTRFSSLGENLAMAGGAYYANNFPTAGKTMAWYYEELDWDYNALRSKGGATGHFTQVVWKASTHVGCQMWQCGGGMITVMLACQYGPAGNWGGEYGNNVGARGEQATGCSGGTPPTASPVAAPPPPTTSPVAPSQSPVAASTTGGVPPTTSPVAPASTTGGSPTVSPVAGTSGQATGQPSGGGGVTVSPTTVAEALAAGVLTLSPTGADDDSSSWLPLVLAAAGTCTIAMVVFAVLIRRRLQGPMLSEFFEDDTEEVGQSLPPAGNVSVPVMIDAHDYGDMTSI
eukprot:Hpha_TRINITY_DN9126_c0_g1::TRINITY_DN9126_c0_g1_i1::g.94335::m.94335